MSRLFVFVLIVALMVSQSCQIDQPEGLCMSGWRFFCRLLLCHAYALGGDQVGGGGRGAGLDASIV